MIKKSSFYIKKSDVNEVKKSIEGCVGQKVLLRGSLGRNKSFEKEGTLVNTYPDVFAVKMDDSKSKITYTYRDILTNTVEFNIKNGESFDSILNIIGQDGNSVTL